MTFFHVLKVAVICFGTPVWGNNIPLVPRSFANTTSTTESAIATTSSADSSTITSYSAGPVNIYTEFSQTNYVCSGWFGHPLEAYNCPNPFDTIQYPSNIVPANPSLASSCSVAWNSSQKALISALATTTGDTSSGVGYSLAVTAQEPCCLNCTLRAGSISVMVWPTPAPVPPVSALIDPTNNFTFVSPSVYVVFESVGGTNLCGAVGTALINKTVAFEPTELSTQRNFYAATDASDLNVDYCTHLTPNGPWETFDYANAAKGKCEGTTTSFWSHYDTNDTTKYSVESEFSAATNWACIPVGSYSYGCMGMPLNHFTCVYNPCSPWVSVPTQVYDFNPKFSTCIDGIEAFFDPPYTLTKGNGLNAFTSGPTPAGTPTPPIASPTPPPSPSAPTPVPTPASQVESKPLSTASPASSAAAGLSNIAINPNTDSKPSSVDPNGPEIQPPSDPPQSANTQLPQSSIAVSVLVDPSSPVASTPIQPTNPSPSNSPLPIATIGSVTVSRDISSNVIVNSQTIVPGGPAVIIGSQTLSLAPSASAIIVNGVSTASLPSAPAPQIPAQAATTFAVGSQIATAGGAPITVSGTTYSLASGGTAVLVNGATSALSPAATAGPHIVTSDGSKVMLIGSQTLLPGSSLVTSGTTYSLASSGNALVVDGTSQYLVGSQTLVAGGALVTVSGTVISLASGGQSVVVGGSTEPVASFLGTASTPGALGGAILSVGGFSAPSSSTGGGNGTAIQAAGAGRTAGGVEIVGGIWVLCLGMLWML